VVRIETSREALQTTLHTAQTLNVRDLCVHSGTLKKSAVQQQLQQLEHDRCLIIIIVVRPSFSPQRQQSVRQ
jgi:endonuclease IV